MRVQALRNEFKSVTLGSRGPGLIGEFLIPYERRGEGGERSESVSDNELLSGAVTGVNLMMAVTR